MALDRLRSLSFGIRICQPSVLVKFREVFEVIS